MIIRNKVIDRIKESGPMSYAAFMHACLYEFGTSYYKKKDPVGFQADYYTSPYLHPVFGSLIALKLFSMWQAMGQPGVFEVVELGAGNGKLSIDVLDYSRLINEKFYDAIRYVCVEVRSTDIKLFKSHKHKVRFMDMQQLLNTRIRGCILSNEFFDALPVHRVHKDKGLLLEEMVGLHNDVLVNVHNNLIDIEVLRFIKAWEIEIPEGYSVEINILSESYIRDISNVLDEGFVLTIDYGDLSEGLYSMSHRKHGTIRSFKNNVQISNVLNEPGNQDITSHVNFTILIGKGNQLGLKLVDFTSQSTFMKNTGLDWMISRLDVASIDRATYVLNKRRISNLIDENGLGGFKVLIQAKGPLTLNHINSLELLETLKVPLLVADI